LNGGTETLTVTDNHPFWVVNKPIDGEVGTIAAWIDSSQLLPGMLVQTSDGKTLSVVSLAAMDRIEPTYNLTIADYHTYFVGENKVWVHNQCNGCGESTSGTKTIYVDSKGNAIIGDGQLPKNYKGENVIVPEGHVMSPRDPGHSEAPVIRIGPYTDEQRGGFLNGTGGGTKLSPHHRNQIPTEQGGVIDEIPGPGHPAGNQHTAGTPSRHPAESIFNRKKGGDAQRGREINQHWKAKGQRLEKVDENTWIDPNGS
jgi:hypothetical protein